MKIVLVFVFRSERIQFVALSSHCYGPASCIFPLCQGRVCPSVLRNDECIPILNQALANEMSCSSASITGKIFVVINIRHETGINHKGNTVINNDK